ncbi:MAG: hypothetical protein ACI4XF_04265, partial [Oscillospiraceae bacterium]
TIEGIDTLLNNFRLAGIKDKLLDKFSDRLDGCCCGMKKLDRIFTCDLKENTYLIAGLFANKKIFYSYPPINIETGRPIPDDEIYGLLLFVKAREFSAPVALKLQLDSQKVYYYALSDDDTRMINENKILLRDWYRSRCNDFRLLFRMYGGSLLTRESIPLPKLSPSETVFGTDVTINKLAAAGITAQIGNLIHNGLNVEITSYRRPNYEVKDYCMLSYDISFFGKETRSEHFTEFTGLTLSTMGMLAVENNIIYLMTEFGGMKKEMLRLNDKIMSLICTERYLFVTTCKEEITSKQESTIGGAMDIWNEDTEIFYTQNTRKRLPTTHVYDIYSKQKLGAVRMLGSISRIVRSAEGLTVTCTEKISSCETQPKTFTISSSPERIVSDLQRITG